jgi:hypothetical protein
MKNKFGKVIVKQPKTPDPGFGKVTVKQPPVKEKSPGKVIVRDLADTGKGPSAAEELASLKIPSPKKVAPVETHVAGIEIPHELKDHFHGGQVVPYEHPLREGAVKFVTDVWRKNKAEGMRMSDKLLGVGDSSVSNHVNAKPGYATIKSERLTLIKSMHNVGSYFNSKMRAMARFGQFHRTSVGTDEDSCTLDFKPHINELAEKVINQNLSSPPKREVAIAKGAKEDYSQSLAEKRLLSNMAQTKAPEGKTKTIQLLTPESANVKTAKNANVGGHYSEMLSLAPANLAGRGNVCPGLSAGCKASCLNTAGMGGMVSEKNPVNVVQESRIKKTRHLFDDPHDFFNQLDRNIDAVKKKATKNGLKPVIRLNGTSDLAWENFRPPGWQGMNVFEKHPDVQFHDYTARPERVRSNKHPNYHLTFSLKEDNHDIAKRLLAEGHNVAVPFGFKTAMATKEEKEKQDYSITRPLPPTYWGHKVLDGEKHDLRFLDLKGDSANGGYIVGLRAKGDAMSDTSGFVQWGHEGQPDAQPRAKKAKTKEQIIAEGLRSQASVKKSETLSLRRLLKKEPNLGK